MLYLNILVIRESVIQHQSKPINFYYDFLDIEIHVIFKPECLYGAETLFLNRNKYMRKIGNKHFWKILGPKDTEDRNM